MALLALLCLSVLFHATIAGDLGEEWQKWKSTYGRIYDSEEEPTRYAIWKSTRNIIDSHNAAFKKGITTYTMKLNNFADKKEEELMWMLIQNKKTNIAQEGSIKDALECGLTRLPWHKYNYLKYIITLKNTNKADKKHTMIINERYWPHRWYCPTPPSTPNPQPTPPHPTPPQTTPPQTTPPHPTPPQTTPPQTTPPQPTPPQPTPPQTTPPQTTRPEPTPPPTTRPEPTRPEPELEPERDVLYVDWREEGYVTPVQDQGPIQSSYAFSALGALEGQDFKATKRLKPLSEQQVVDCDQGGNGGVVTKVYEYAYGAGGIQYEVTYPYTGRVEECKVCPCSLAVTGIDAYALVIPTEEALERAVLHVGPISVSDIKVLRSLLFYSSGIYYEPDCAEARFPIMMGYQAMLTVGYGSEEEKDYWIVKNSWGEGWGEDGYIRMSRNKNNNCGIASNPAYPILEDESKQASIQALDGITTTASGAKFTPALHGYMLSVMVLAIFA